MKYLKKIIFILISIITFLFIYDLADYDSNYLNRSNFFFDKNNLNSKYSKNIYSIYEGLTSKIKYNFIWEKEKERFVKSITKEEKITLNYQLKDEDLNFDQTKVNF